MKPGIEKRLEASIETATKLADGLVHGRGGRRRRAALLAQLACPDCGIDVPQLEPRSFSFNSPYGACEECHGLGSSCDFDPGKVIVDLVEAAARRRPGPGRRLAESAAAAESKLRQHKFDLASRSRSFPRRLRTCCSSRGGKAKRIPGHRRTSCKQTSRRSQLRRLSRVADRLHVADRVRPAMASACGRRAWRCSVKGIRSPTSPRLPISRALMTVRDWELNERETQIAGRMCDEIRRAPGVPRCRGPRTTSEPRPLGRNAFRRRRPAHPPRDPDRFEAARRALRSRRASIGLHPRDNERLLETLAATARSGQHRAGGRAR